MIRSVARIPTGTRDRAEYMHVAMSKDFTDQFRRFLLRFAEQRAVEETNDNAAGDDQGVEQAEKRAAERLLTILV